MDIKEIYLGSYEIINDKKIIGKINKVGNKYMVTRNEQEAGYIIVKEFIQRYSAFDNNDDVLGDGNFEDMLFLFFK